MSGIQAYEDDKREKPQVDRAGNNIMHMAVLEGNRMLFDTLYSAWRLEKPPCADIEPEIWGSELRIWGSEPEIRGSEPEIWGSEPEICGSEPEICASKPEI